MRFRILRREKGAPRRPAPAPEPPAAPTVTPAAPVEETETPEPPLSFGIPLYEPTPAPEAAPQPVSAENAAAFRSEPDEDGWISITSEPVERIEDCTADKVRISRICFRAAGSFMQRVCRHLDLFSFQVQELKKELKKK